MENMRKEIKSRGIKKARRDKTVKRGERKGKNEEQKDIKEEEYSALSSFCLLLSK